MGGTGLYHPPVKSWTDMASWADHTNRSTPSTEPGVDWYCPRFTELHAAASGVVVGVFYGIGPATGRYITIDLDDGKRVRYLHLEEIYVTVGQRVAWGEVIGKTGATGYGEADWSWNVTGTGGAHVHETIFPGHYYVFGRYATLDPWPLTDTSSASLAGSEKSEEDDVMKFIEGPDLIVWPNGVICAYDNKTFTVIRQYVNFPTDETWSRGRETFEREAWAAFNTGAGLTAAAVARALPAGAQVDVGVLAKAVAEAMPKTFTVVSP